MNIKTEKKVFYFMVSAAIAFSLILANGTVQARMDRPLTEVTPKLEVPSPIVPLNDCGEYQYQNCQPDYDWCQQFRNPASCWSYVGSCVTGGGTSTFCRQRCAQYGVHCQSPQ